MPRGAQAAGNFEGANLPRVIWIEFSLEHVIPFGNTLLLGFILTFTD